MRKLIQVALDEDFAAGPDVTSLATIDAHLNSTADIIAREAGVLAGSEAVDITVELVSQGEAFEVTHHVQDGQRFSAGDRIATITAPTRTLLAAERTMLNVVSHASAIATHTRRWVDAVAGTSAAIRDTRKTLPGMRELQKYAVRCGGGVNHRMGLGDAAMIKDNHVVAAGGVVEAFQRLVAQYPDVPREVEVDSIAQLRDLLPLQPELILLDNFSLAETAEAVGIRDELSPATKLESSGGLQLANAREYAETGVDFLAVGALTHTVTVLDLGLDFR